MNPIQSNKIKRHDIKIKVKVAVQECLKRKMKPIRKNLVFEMMSKEHISERTAKEILNLALWELNLDKNFMKLEKQERLLNVG